MPTIISHSVSLRVAPNQTHQTSPPVGAFQAKISAMKAGIYAPLWQSAEQRREQVSGQGSCCEGAASTGTFFFFFLRSTSEFLAVFVRAKVPHPAGWMRFVLLLTHRSSNTNQLRNDPEFHSVLFSAPEPLTGFQQRLRKVCFLRISKKPLAEQRSSRAAA